MVRRFCIKWCSRGGPATCFNSRLRPGLLLRAPSCHVAADYSYLVLAIPCLVYLSACPPM
jgi:hypothetical protein